MLHTILGSVGTFASFFGILTNLYVLLVLLRSKKARSSNEWILLHLSSCGLAASFSNLLCLSPSVFLERWVVMGALGCHITGAATLSLQLLIVWSICALSADRCAAIVSPLRYTQLVTRRKVAAFFFSTWVIAIGIVLLSSFINPTTKSGDEGGEAQNVVVAVPHLVEGEDVGMPQASSHVNSYISDPPPTSISNNNNNNFMLEGLDQNGIMSSLNNDNLTLNHHLDSSSSISGPFQVLQVSGSGNVTGQGSVFQYRPLMGVCLPKLSSRSVINGFWVSTWIILILVAPMITLLICDFTVLSIARKQRHRIIMALYQITAVTQVTVTGSKGTPLPGLWLNRSVPARSRACRAVWEDMTTLAFLHFPLILIFILESILDSHSAPWALDFIASLSLFAAPSLTAVLYGIRARPLRTAYKSYLRKRLTNSTLQHEIQQRLSPVDGSPRLSGSRIKSFRSTSPSPNSSPNMTPRRQSTNDLRPPPIQLTMSISPSHGNLGRNHTGNHVLNHIDDNIIEGGNKRKVRSFLHIPSQVDMQEFWSGIGFRRPNRSPTIVITHELRIKDSSNSLSHPPSPAAEQRL